MNLLPSTTSTTNPGPAPHQTRHPLASRTLGELQDLANAAEAEGRTIPSGGFSPRRRYPSPPPISSQGGCRPIVAAPRWHA